MELGSWDYGAQIEVTCKDYYNDISPCIHVILQFEPGVWNKPYSILEFTKVFNKLVESEANYELYSKNREDVIHGFGITSSTVIMLEQSCFGTNG